jgi:hypothetical protein
MNKIRNSILLTVCLILAAFGGALAQAQELTLSLNRDFGYSSGTGRIQGTFSMKVKGPDDLVRVVFFIDGQTVSEDNEAPFQFQFQTGSFSLGVHTLNATGYTTGGLELQSNEYRREFVAAGESLKGAGQILLPVLGIVLLAILLSYGLPTLLGRGKRSELPLGAPRNYGIQGGAICPKCSRPFAVHIYGFNLIVGKLDRCPYCGRWSLVRRSSLAELRAAEAAELADAQKGAAQFAGSEEENLRKELDESRFHDL